MLLRKKINWIYAAFVSALTILIVFMAAACDGPPEVAFEQCIIPIVPDSAVDVEDSAFSFDGEEIVPHGINSYPLLQHVGDGNLEAIRDILGQATSLGRPFLRTNGFMDGGNNPARIRDDEGNIREEGLQALDLVVAEATDAGVTLVLIFTNNWEDYGGASAVVEAVAPGEGLPKDAFWSEPRAVEAQRLYVQTIVGRTNSITGLVYGDDPAIFGFELANEARCDDPDWCSPNTLGDWAFEMSEAAREAGANQPIFWGGQGFINEHGEDLEDIGQRGGVDVLTLHLYLQYSHAYLYTFPEAERISAAIQVGASIISNRARLSQELGLPLVVEEFGWKPASPNNPDAERSAIYKGWLATAHDKGIATMPWMIGETNRPDYDGLLIRPSHTSTWNVISCQ